MLPLLKPGDELLVVPGARGIIVGDIVVAYHPNPTGPKIIKRVSAIHGETVDLRGDNPSESADYPGYSIEKIIGKVISRF
jgi:phage repressor protein C with HTH and peptisase S24 domain